MKLKALKQILNSLSETELEKEITYSSAEYSISGTVSAVTKTKANLYWDGEDDPSTLYTKKQLKQNGVDQEEIDEYTIEIKKGELVFWLDKIQA